MPYLEGVGSLVNVIHWHIPPVLCALAVRLTQLEGLRLQSQRLTFIAALPGDQLGGSLESSSHFVIFLTNYSQPTRTPCHGGRSGVNSDQG
jgi:hypothetical protein